MSDFVVNGRSARPAPSQRPSLSPAGRRLALHLAGITALVFVLVTSDAFGSDELPLGRRVLMFAIIASLLVGQASLLADAARRLGRSSFIGAIAAVAGTWILMTIEVHALKATPIVPYAPDPLPEFALFLMPFVVPVSALVLGLKWVASGNAAVPALAAEPIAQATAVADAPAYESGDALDGWPADAVQRVQALDHYMQLWTPRGTMLVRGRMRDALRRLPAGAGIRTHRSWWVALSEIERLERRGRDHVLRLRNGDRVPVARARAEEVRRLLGDERKRP